jgi:DNA mismatch repair protein MutS2
MTGKTLKMVNLSQNVSLKAGDKVFVEILGCYGTVLKCLQSKGLVVVQVGSNRLNISMQKIKKIAKASGKIYFKTSHKERHFKKKVLEELYVRRLPVEDALRKVDEYLYNAVAADLYRIKIIHGKGSGILRESIHKLLAEHPKVESFELGDFIEGGFGTTVVKLK